MKKTSLGDLLINAFVGAFALFCVLPIALILITSFASEKSITLNGYSFFPSELSLDAYRMMFGPGSAIPSSYVITIAVTLVGTLFAVLITFGAGYTLANKQCRYRGALAVYFFVTMVFNTGLVPWYMVTKNLGMYDNFWALIVPSLMFSPFNMFLVRNYVQGIPDSLYESAVIDGASEFTIISRIYFPLCVPVVSTITLFYGISYWNNYFNAVMLVDNVKLFPLQMLLFKIQSQISQLSMGMQGVSLNPPKESFKMAVCIITMGPIVLLYPFLQRYFIKGIIVGAVKG